MFCIKNFIIFILFLFLFIYYKCLTGKIFYKYTDSITGYEDFVRPHKYIWERVGCLIAIIEEVYTGKIVHV